MPSVTFPTALGGNGSTYSDTDMLNGGHSTRFIPMLAQEVLMAQSASSNALAASSSAAAALASQILAAASAASVAGISVGSDILSAPKNASMGSAAFLDIEQLPIGIFPMTLSAAYTLVNSDGGKAVLSNAFNIILPDSARCTVPWGIRIKNTHATTSITVARAGSDTIDGTTAITLTAGMSKLIIKSASGAFVSL